MTRSILIVDDDAVFASTLALSFERKGIQACVALNKEQALAAVGQQQFTDITLDLNLGEQSGLQLIAQLRSFQAQANLLVLTGYASIANAVQAVKLGADDYLTKPVDFLQLEQAITGKAQNGTAADTAVLLSPEQLEWEHIHRVLAEQSGNISRTAELLGMHRRTLQRKLNKHRPC